ncbi:MAG: hypothetical protein JSR54_04705 [Proteobacteria bacterium]|nr:hypothetical protein [Pseudomonadota bacterium]
MTVPGLQNAGPMRASPSIDGQWTGVPSRAATEFRIPATRSAIMRALASEQGQSLAEVEGELAPFGGIGEPGFGRVGSKYGVFAYAEIMQVWVGRITAKGSKP